jgi:CshA-type fibril repeat protein
MFDAALIDTAASEAASDSSANSPESQDSSQENQNDLAVALGHQDPANSLYVFDGNLPDLQTLTSAVPEGAQILILDAEDGSLNVIAAYVEGLDQPLSAVHIVTHGSDNQLQIGNDLLTSENLLTDYADALNILSSHLSESADILIYGCDFAAGSDGLDTLEALSKALSADIAASDDVTGSSGDWDLEVQTGNIEAESLSVEEWDNNLLNLFAPEALPDVLVLDEDTSATIDVTANDIDLDGDSIIVTDANASFGVVTINPDNTLTYTPDENYFGVDTITYTIEDSQGAEALLAGTVAVTVNPIDDLPTLALPTLVDLFVEDTAIIFAGLYGNQISIGDIDGGVVEVALSVPVGHLTLDQTAGLTLSQGDGVNDNEIIMRGDIADINAALNGLIYTPDADYNGPVTISIDLIDPLLSLPIVTAQLPLGIEAVVDITDDHANVIENTPASFNVLSNDTFENALASITSFTTPANGLLTLTADGDAVYTPNPGFTGTDTFTYTVTSSGTTETATVTLQIDPPNAPPSLTIPGTQNGYEDTSLIFSGANGNAITLSDSDDGTLTVTVTSSHGELILGSTAGLSIDNGDATGDTSITFTGSIADINLALDGLTYTPTADYYGSATVTVSANDGTNSQTSSINVLLVGDTDGVTDDVLTDVQTPVTFSPLSNDKFSASAVVTAVAGAEHGTATIGAGNTITYTPDSGYRGMDTLTYTVSSGGVTEEITVNITVGADNNAPITNDTITSITVNDSDVFVLDMSTAFTDLDLFDELTFTGNNWPPGLSVDAYTGVVSGQIDKHASISNGNGIYNASIRALDRLGLFADVDVTVTVVNQNPVISLSVVTTTEDIPLSVDVLLNSSDPDGDLLTLDAASAANGIVTINNDGTLLYTPNQDFFGTDIISVTVIDEDGGSTTSDITVVVDPAPDLPTIGLSPILLFNEDEPLIFADVLGQEISLGDVDGEVLDIKLSVPIGTLSLTETAGISITEGDGTNDSIIRLNGSVADLNVALDNLVYMPGADYNGNVMLSIELGQLGQLLNVTAELPLGIQAVVDITDDSVTTYVDTTASFNVLDNDTFEHTGRVVDSYTTPAHGSITITDQGDAIYTPDAGYTGTDTFTYTVLSNGTYETATVTINIETPNAPPVLSLPGAQNGTEDTDIVFSASNGNAIAFTDTDSSTLTVTLAATDGNIAITELTRITFVSGSASGGANFTISGSVSDVNNALEGLTYSPNADFYGTASLTVSVNDGNNTEIGVTPLLIVGETDGVVDDVTTEVQTPISFTPLDNDTFAPGASIVSVSGASHGTVSLGANNEVTYTPDAGYRGTDTLTYTVSSGGVTEDVTVNVTVGINNAPTGLSLIDLTLGDGDVVLIDAAAAFSDADLFDQLTYSATGLPNGLSIDPNTGAILGSIDTHASVLNGDGIYDVNVTATDLLGLSTDVGFTLTVINPDPIIGAQVLTTLEDIPLSVDVLLNSSDPDGDALTLNAASAANGVVTLNDDGTLLYTPNPNFFGTDIITVSILDEDGGSATSFLNVVVDPVVDVPTISLSPIVLFNEDEPLIFADVLGQEISLGDVDGEILDIKLSVPVGSLTLTQTAGVSITEGDGTNDSIIRLNGSVADLNVVLDNLVYMPGADYNGNVLLSIELGQLGQLLNVTAELPLGIQAVVDITDDSVTTYTDTAVSFNVLDNDTFEHTGRIVDSYTNPSFGSVSITDQGVAVYTPDAGFTGTDTFTYTVLSNGTYETATVTVNIDTPPNTTPVANPIADETANDGQLISLDVSTAFSDPDGDPLIYSASGLPAGITIDVNTGVISGTLGSSSSQTVADGKYAITITAQDGRGGVVSQGFTLTVNNPPPSAVDDAFSGSEDQTLTGNVLTNDSDSDGDNLSVSTTPVSAPLHGTLTLNSNGSFTYVPDANYNGTDSFVYSVMDADGASSTATVTLTIGAVNDGPVANDDSASTNEDSSVTIDVLANDTDVDGDSLTVDSATAANGSVTINPDGTLTYTPNADFNGVDTITYTITDGNGGTSTATATITVNAVNDNPIANDDTATVAEDGSVAIDVLANDTDVDGDTPTVTAASATNGTVTINPDGTVQYTPNTDFNGIDTITYTIDDGNGGTATATVTVTVNAQNDAPVANNDVGSTDEDTAVTVDVLDNDTDVDGDALTVDSAAAANGSVTINPDGTLTYTPNVDFNGVDTITYSISDGNGGTSTATATITVNAVNDNPVANDDTATVAEDGSVAIDVLANDTDADGDTPTVTAASATNGTVTINPDGTVQYTPNTDFNGIDTITYTIDDGNGGTATATVTVTVNAQNDAPVANSDVGSTDEDTAVTVDVLANDTDVDGDSLSVDSATAANGSVTINPDGTLTYTPNADFNGVDTITYSISDGNGGTSTATATITVNAVNDNPVANDDNFNTVQNTPTVLDVLANDTDIDGDSLTVTAASATNGSLIINPDNTISYVPNIGFTGTDTVTYTISDGNGGTATATASVFVNAPTNNAPTANADSATTDEDVAINVDALANDSDPDGDTLTVTSASATNGTVSVNPDGTIAYTPNANFSGTDTVTYTISDGRGGSDTSTVSITVNAVNDAPVAADDNVTTNEDTPRTINVLANDTDVDGDSLTVDSASATNGSVTINPDGTLTYTPNADFNGVDTITYTISDGNGGTSTATATITVNAVNDNPVANDDTATVAEDGSVAIDVLANDTDVDGDTPTVTAASATNGSVTINPDGTVQYTPNTDFNGIDTITYTIDDGNGGTATATVTVTVSAQNDAPVANNDVGSTDEDTAVTVDVLANDTDADGDALTVDSATAANGSATINPDGTLTYTPNADFNGVDTITYSITDGNGGTSTATATITVNAVNDNPIANNDTATVAEDGSVAIDVLANDTDVDGDTPTVTAASATNGTVTINPDGTVQYTPNTDFNGIDTITYTIDDGNGGTATATVTVTVSAQNDAPVANNDLGSTDEDTAVTVDVLANDTDADGDSLSVDSATAANGSVTINPDGTLTYTPNADFNGVDTITYSITDGNGGTSTATATITVNAVNDNPVANDDTATVAEDGSVAVDVLANDTDVDGDTPTVTAASATNGTVTINPDGTVQYTPNADFNGIDTITYTIDDGNGGTATATVTVTVNAQNDAPVANNDVGSTDEDTAVTVDVLANDTDADGDSLSVDSATAASGSVTINPDGTLTYTPNADFNGVDTITYTITDGNGGTSTATATITVNAVNDNPVANDDNVNTVQNTPTVLDVLANDTDIDGDSLTVTSASAVNGTLVINPDSSISYVPNTGFTGTDTVTYTISDGNGGTATATATVFVNAPGNTAPTANADFATTNEDASVSVDALANDTDGDGDTLTVAAASANNGSVAINPDGTITYTPNADYNGVETITYTISDGNGGSDTSTISVTVNPVNDNPVATDDNVSTNEDTVRTINVLANDTDVDGDSLTVTTALAANGTISINPDGTLSYTPNTGFNGVDTISYSISDGNGGTSSATVTVTVNSVNDAPVANDDTASVSEDGSVAIDVLANDTDVDGDTPTVTAASATNGTVSINPDGTIQYTPNADFNGIDTITYTIDDGNGGVWSATVTVTVSAQNDAPVANNETSSTDEDTPVTLDVLANDTDVDGDSLSVDTATAGNGTVVINPDGTLTYTPDANFNGVDTITYTITDGNGGTTTATATITVNAVNDNPVANDDTAVVPEDGSLVLNVLANDSDPDGDALTVTSASATNGSVIINPNGSLQYSPTADFNGIDTITYTIDDGNGGTSTATVTITVNPQNDGPVANDDAGTTNEDTPLLIDLTANDTDIDGDTLTVDSATAANGSVAINPDGTVTYTPNSNFNGVDTITYTITDGNGGSSSATATITVNAVNDNPNTTDDSATVAEDSSVTIDVLSNDTDVEGDPITVTAATATNGSVTINPDGTLNYTPNPDFNGVDTISYTVDDGNGGTTTATVTVTVSAENDAPVANNDAGTTDEDTPITLDVLANDTDIDGDDLTVDSATASNGNVSINPDGSITYTPNANFNGIDTITYTITDGNGGTSTATVSVTVNAVNDAPVVNDDTITTDEDTPVTVDVLANDTDPEGDSLSVDTATATNGTVTINPDGTITYTPNADFNGTDTITYTVTDGNGGTTTATATITVGAVNDAPVVNDDTITTDEDTPVTVDVLANDTDPEGDSLSVDTATATNGTVTINPDGTITYTPNADFNGTDTITYTVTDGNGGTTTATATVTVGAVNDDPVVNDDTFTTDEDTPVTVDVLANDTDPEGDSLSVDTATATNGTVTINPDGTITYTPNADFNGTDTITYTVTDGNGGTTTSTATVTVGAVNDAPAVNDDSVTTDEDTPITIDVLGNDTDPDGDSLSVDTATATNGTVTINPDGTITYTPNPDFNGTDTITFSVTDGNGGTTQSQADVTVNPVNDAPEITGPTEFEVNEDESLVVNLSDIVTDPENDTLIVDSVTTNNGQVIVGEDNSITFIPNPDFTGTDTFTLTVTDGSDQTQTVVITVTVIPNPEQQANVIEAAPATEVADLVTDPSLDAEVVEYDPVLITAVNGVQSLEGLANLGSDSPVVEAMTMMGQLSGATEINSQEAIINQTVSYINRQGLSFGDTFSGDNANNAINVEGATTAAGVFQTGDITATDASDLIDEETALTDQDLDDLADTNQGPNTFSEQLNAQQAAQVNDIIRIIKALS